MNFISATADSRGKICRPLAGVVPKLDSTGFYVGFSYSDFSSWGCFPAGLIKEKPQAIRITILICAGVYPISFLCAYTPATLKKSMTPSDINNTRFITLTQRLAHTPIPIIQETGRGLNRRQLFSTPRFSSRGYCFNSSDIEVSVLMILESLLSTSPDSTMAKTEKLLRKEWRQKQYQSNHYKTINRLGYSLLLFVFNIGIFHICIPINRNHDFLMVLLSSMLCFCLMKLI